MSHDGTDKVGKVDAIHPSRLNGGFYSATTTVLVGGQPEVSKRLNPTRGPLT